MRNNPQQTIKARNPYPTYGHLGHKHSKKTRKLLSQKTEEWLKKHPHPFKGKRHTDEAKVKIREKRALQAITDEHKEAIRRGHLKRPKPSQLFTRESRERAKQSLRLHYEIMMETVEDLESQGFQCIPIGTFPFKGTPVPDIIAIEGNPRIYAVEITDRPKFNKYKGQTCYDDIWWISKKEKVRNGRIRRLPREDQ